MNVNKVVNKNKKSLAFDRNKASNMNNGFSSNEEDSRGPADQMCCLVDEGDICRNAAGNASYSKRVQKTVAQRRLKLDIAPNVRSPINLS